MTEHEARYEILKLAVSWLGKQEADGSHKEIIDIYNSYTPHPRGYVARYTDSWCAMTISALAIKLGMTDIIPVECGCPQQVAWFQAQGRWMENDNYDPVLCDIIYYDWQDNGTGDNTGTPDHVGIVVGKSWKNLSVLEGNYNDSVALRTISIGARYIRGYGLPDYAGWGARHSGTPDIPEPVRYTAESFLQKIKEPVIDDMRRTGILASLTAAQALLESDRGNSRLTRDGNNLFGMKTGTGWQGKTVTMMTKEWKSAQYVDVAASFRAYDSWADSIADHSSLFLRYDRYANLRGCTDYRAACRYVREDGYATSPTYTDSLIRVIDQYKLYEWDREVLDAQEGSLSRYAVDRALLREKGEQSIEVVLLQCVLAALGYPIQVTGVYDDQTIERVTSIQRVHGLTVDGIAGQETWGDLLGRLK